MSGISQDHLAQVRAQSDQAFLKMQMDADKAHADFLQQYGRDLKFDSTVHPGSASTAYPAGPGPQVVNPSQPSPPTGQPSRSTEPNPAEKLYETTAKLNLGAMSRESLDDSVQDVRKDLGKLSANLREESRAAAREAMKGTSDILKGNVSGLGQKAKEEATRLKEAMKKAMEEERSLKSKKGRAQQELKKARERFKTQVEDTKQEAMGDLKQMAQGSLDTLKGKAMGAMEQGQEAVEREWNDFISGQDSN